ncbi:hypothetical protein CCR94_00530 [Rhodoblastus sphagnicola]|uniref:Uncharacterized protein n=1 Tax=Rhodoblastus sphagnicola TaxID=333368 RepID=A0A2S6NGX2_9HYPH|nr:hypothetical protein CCR94_00530 [Rhodoblastus sphagnicola]
MVTTAAAHARRRFLSVSTDVTETGAPDVRDEGAIHRPGMELRMKSVWQKFALSHIAAPSRGLEADADLETRFFDSNPTFCALNS